MVSSTSASNHAKEVLLLSAVSLGCTVVTDNEREFARVDKLALENWLRLA